MNNSGRIPWNVTAICETFKISCLMGRPHERRFGVPFYGRPPRLERMLEYHIISATGLSRLHQFGPKVLPGIFHGYALHAGWIWKGDILVADVEELEQMDASDLHAKKTQCKGSVNVHEWWKVTVPNRRWNSQTFWRRSCSENIHLNPGSSGTRRGTRLIFEENQTGPLQPHFETHRGMMVELGKISGPCQAISFTVIMQNPGSNCTCRKKNHFLFTWYIYMYVCIFRRYQNYRYILGCNLGENIEDYWNVEGDRELSETWTGFNKFHFLVEKPPDGYTWSGWILTRKQTTSRPDTLWPEIWKDMSDASKRKEKQKWAIEKPKLDNARRLRGIYFIEHDCE